MSTPAASVIEPLGPPNPDISDLRMRTLFEWFRESPGWAVRHPLGPVTWDARCSRCGFTLEDKPLSKAYDACLEGEGRIIVQRLGHLMVCTECAPI